MCNNRELTVLTLVHVAWSKTQPSAHIGVSQNKPFQPISHSHPCGVLLHVPSNRGK